MRLVSSYYKDFYPFNTFNLFHTFVSSADRDILTHGDVLVVWGGQDIPPEYYGRSRSWLSGASHRPSMRDQVEWSMMQRAKELNIPIIGVCRGAQMLCALAGGYLMQHVTNHAEPDHVITTPQGKQYWVNSLHHQMMVPAKTKHEVLGEVPGDALRSKMYVDEDQPVEHNQEPELVWFNDVNGLAIQWHPEMMAAQEPATQYIKQIFTEKVVETR